MAVESKDYELALQCTVFDLRISKTYNNIRPFLTQLLSRVSKKRTQSRLRECRLRTETQQMLR